MPILLVASSQTAQFKYGSQNTSIFLNSPISASTPLLGWTKNAVRAAYWFSDSGFPVSDIDSTLFTHLFCAFTGLNPQTNRFIIASENQARFSTFTRTVQQKNPSVKTLLSIGGGDANATDFDGMASQAVSRKSFIDSAIRLARSNNFHGLDLDWEYPSNATQDDQLRFTSC
ncbi:hypothetical protein OIU77_030833 [Salix suchowensis]|uniref:GH18 domain-containing protein n=1 Tax=Salix suchowensis TaxID=1278906 RepID=A0ABQ9BDC8_9ROSI|nr:hypothetical protein OIU77_030833 [Salix suchowensis]